MIIPTMRPHFAPAGEAAVSPSNWDPWAYWDANLAVTESGTVSQWDDQANTYRMEQGTAADQPVYTAADLAWSNQATISTGDSTDTLALNTTDVPLSSQRWLHDLTTSYDLLILASVTATAPVVLDTSARATGTGIYCQMSTTGGWFRFRIYNAGAIVGAVDAPGSVSVGSRHWVRLRVDVGAGKMAASVDGAAFTEDTTLGTPNTGDASTSLTMWPSPSEGTIPFLHLSQTLADASRQSEQSTYFTDRYGL